MSSISSLVWSTPKEYMNHSVWGQGSNWSSSCVVCSITFRNLRCTVVKLGMLDTIRRRWLHVIKPRQTKNILLLHWIVLKFYICWIPSEDEHLQFFFFRQNLMILLVFFFLILYIVHWCWKVREAILTDLIDIIKTL